MGDIPNNSELFKKLGFDETNQWILYDERFQKFFCFLSENITDENILTENEVLECEEMKARGEWLEGSDCQAKLQQLESEYPGLLEYGDDDVDAMKQEIAQIEAENAEYSELIEDMRNTKKSVNTELYALEHSIGVLHNAEKEAMIECQLKAKQLEELNRENKKLCADANRCFTKTQTPPLFMHQLSIDQYLLKCNSFMQHFDLYIKANFKMHDIEDLECHDVDLENINLKLQKLESAIQHYTLAYLKEKAKAKATQSLIDNIDVSQIHWIHLADMKRETHELQLLNEYHLKNAYTTLVNQLKTYVQQHTQQRLEMVLYENTKLKLQRALSRCENNKRLIQIIDDALSNAELIWIAIQLDLEKTTNRFDNSEELKSQAQSSWQRVQLMRSLNVTHQGNYKSFIENIATQLSLHLSRNVSCEAKGCLYEYEKFGRLLSYAQQSMFSNQTYTITLEKFNELKRLEKILRPFVYNSPLETPMLEHVCFLSPVFNAKMQQHCIDRVLRNLRTQFREEVVERMDKDKLWRYSQLLWTWFLTDPRRMINAINEVKKVSAHTAGLKSLAGIKRK